MCFNWSKMSSTLVMILYLHLVFGSWLLVRSEDDQH
jgi:hypothetical protein